MRRYELEPRYDSRASFYGKARVEDYGHRLVLVSYSTDVAYVIGRGPSKKVKVNGLYSNTTTRHIKEFLKQNGFRADNSKQIMADYGVSN